MKQASTLLIVLFLFLSQLFFNGCSQPENSSIKDIIPNINLEYNTEKEIVISDLFYSENYNVEFLESDDINIEHSKISNSVKLKSKSDFVGMTLINFTLEGVTCSFPVTIHKNASYKFQFTPDRKYKELYLFGSFNGWNRKDIAMTDEDGDGTFEAETTLEPGVYPYKFFGDGEEIVDPVNPNKVPNGFGSFNSLRTIEEKASEKIFLHVRDLNNETGVLNFEIEGSQFSKGLSNKNIIAFLDNRKFSAEIITLNQNSIAITLPPSVVIGKKTIRVAVTKGGRTTNFQHVILED